MVVFIFWTKKPIVSFGLEIIILWLMIYETYFNFHKINKIAGNLFIPYMLWVSFATLLTVSILVLNW